MLLAAALTSCGGKTGAGGATSPRVSDPIDFPLYGGSSVLSVRDWRHTLTPGERSELGISASSTGVYGGHEVVTATTASFDDVTLWLRDVDNRPPDGYHDALLGSGVDQARMSARNIGIDFSVFNRDERDGPHDVVVLAVDPDLVQSKAGFVLSMLDKFRRLPSFLRDPIDAQAKKETGFTVSDAVDPNTPLGVAVDALSQLHEAQARGVIFFDAQRVGSSR